MSSFRPINISRDGNQLVIDGPFAAKNLIKTIPHRRWDSARKAWIVPADLEEEARLILSTWWRGVSNEYGRVQAPEPTCSVCGRRIIPVDGIHVHPGCEVAP